MQAAYRIHVDFELGDVGLCGGDFFREPGEKKPRSNARTNYKLNPHMALSRNRTQATLVGSERSQYYVIRAPSPPPHVNTSTMGGVRKVH